ILWPYWRVDGAGGKDHPRGLVSHPRRCPGGCGAVGLAGAARSARPVALLGSGREGKRLCLLEQLAERRAQLLARGGVAREAVLAERLLRLRNRELAIDDARADRFE